MPADRTTPRRVSAFVTRIGVAAAFLLVGGVGCGGKREYAPDANDRGAWRYGSVPGDFTVVASGVAGTTGSTFTAVTTPSAVPSQPTGPASAPPIAPPTPTPSPTPSTTTKSSSPSGSYKAIAVKDGGSIHAICRLVNAPAEIETVIAFKDQMKGCKDHKSERCRFVKKGDGDLRLGNCLIFLRSIREGKDWPDALRGDERTYLIDQKTCVYVPHVGWTRPSTQVVVANSDRADHNIHGNFGNDTQFNFGSEPGTRKDGIAEAFLEKPGEYFVKCDIHPWMNSYVHLIPHPYAAITPEADGDGGLAGEVILDNVPPGPYDVICWHEGMISTVGMAAGAPIFNYSPEILDSQHVEISAGGRREITFTVTYK